MSEDVEIGLSQDEVELLIEALQFRASRHESYGRNRPRSAGPHDRKARAMRNLRRRLMHLVVCEGISVIPT